MIEIIPIDLAFSEKQALNFPTARYSVYKNVYYCRYAIAIATSGDFPLYGVAKCADQTRKSKYYCYKNTKLFDFLRRSNAKVT